MKDELLFSLSNLLWIYENESLIIERRSYE